MFKGAFLTSIFLDVSQIQLLFPILGKIYLQKIVLLVAIIGLIIEKGRFSLLVSSESKEITRILVLLLIWVFLSIPFGVYPGNSVSFVLESYWKILLVFLLFLAYSSNSEDLERITWAYVYGIGLLALITILRSHGGRMEISSDVYDANDTALQLLLGLPFAFWKYRTYVGMKSLLSLAISLIIIVGLVKTDSRGGFLGFVIVALVMFKQSNRVSAKTLFKFAFTIFTVGGLVVVLGGDEYINRISTIFNPEQDYNVTSNSGRLQIWSRGIDMMLSNPVFGVGVSNFIAADGILYRDVGAHYQAAHNSFVQIGAELGVPGLLFFVLLIYRSVKRIRRTCACYLSNSSSVEEIRIVNTGYAIVGAWVAYMVTGFFLSAAYISSYYILIALSILFSRCHYENEIAI